MDAQNIFKFIIGFILLFIGWLLTQRIRQPVSQGAKRIEDYLKNNGIFYLKEIPFVVNGRNYRFDFQVGNTFIEFDGEQHFKFNDFFYKNYQEFLDAQDRDRIKTREALRRGYNVTRIAYNIDVRELGNTLRQGLSTRGLYLSDPRLYGYL